MEAGQQLTKELILSKTVRRVEVANPCPSVTPNAGHAPAASGDPTPALESRPSRLHAPATVLPFSLADASPPLRHSPRTTCKDHPSLQQSLRLSRGLPGRTTPTGNSAPEHSLVRLAAGSRRLPQWLVKLTGGRNSILFISVSPAGAHALRKCLLAGWLAGCIGEWMVAGWVDAWIHG